MKYKRTITLQKDCIAIAIISLWTLLLLFNRSLSSRVLSNRIISHDFSTKFVQD